MSRYQVWRCAWCGGVRFQLPEYPMDSSEIHSCSPTEGAHMTLLGYVEVEPQVEP